MQAKCLLHHDMSIIRSVVCGGLPCSEAYFRRSGRWDGFAGLCGLPMLCAMGVRL